MKEPFDMIHQMRTEGVIGAYAIGGAVGATFYLEPVATLDLDVFVAFEKQAGSSLISLEPIYRYLKAKGHAMRGEYVVIGTWPVQFLPTADALGEEAVAAAVEVEIKGTPTRVMTAEHLVAIALNLGRGKDHARVLQFVEAGVLNMARLQDILGRHGLTDKWTRFERRFLEDGA
jgi:hypothetical protein